MKPDHTEDYLVTFGQDNGLEWSDTKNKIYSNLIVHDGGSGPIRIKTVQMFVRCIITSDGIFRK